MATMPTKKLKLTDLNLSNQQIVDLFKISSSVYELALHDLNGHGAHIRINLELVLELFSSLKRERLLNRKRKEADDKISIIDESLKTAWSESAILVQSMHKFFNPYRPISFDEQFISRPFDIVQSIKDMRHYPDITVGKKSLKSLEIVFPNNILFGILSELVENAARPVGRDIKVMINWRMRGTKFQCEVHDNGPGLSHRVGNKFLPLDALNIGVKGKRAKKQGLKIINRILILAKGLLLFSNSKPLGGTLIYFEFPVLGTNKDK